MTLVQRLPVSAPLDGLHHEVFRGQEGQGIPVRRAAHDLLVDMEPGGDVLAQAQDGVGAQKALRHGDAAVGGVVQRALQPLNRGGHGGIERRPP